MRENRKRSLWDCRKPIGRWLIALIAGAFLVVSFPHAAHAAERRPENFSGEEVILTEPLSGQVRSGALESTNAGTGAQRPFTGIDAATYQVLRDRIVKLVEENGSDRSAVFHISLNEIGLGGASWTASDLGVSSLIQNNQISSDAINAMMDRMICNANTVIFALTADLPYHLFWFDKTAGISVEPKGNLNVQYDGRAGDYALSFSGEIIYSFTVCGEYSAGAYTISENALSKARNASAQAQKIVKKYASLTDYEKLEAYRWEINTLLDYDYSALSSYVSYGGPWQLLNVFDGNPQTDCVCEGYAKAFQYLCDLSKFSSKTLKCRIATGTVYNSGSGQPHMWNIVTMPDGKNYLVDVTNCENYDNYDGLLFLVGTTNDRWNGVDQSFGVRALNKKNGAAYYTYRYDQSTLATYSAKDLELTTGLYLENNTVFQNNVLTRPDLYLNVGKSFDLVVPGGTVDRMDLSRDPGSVFSVSSEGQFTGKKPGKVTVTLWKDNRAYRQKVIIEFADVKEKDHAYYYDAVNWAVDQGITAGVLNQKSGYYETFAPQGNCTRAQMVSFLWRLAGSPEPKTKKMIFSDVRSSDYYYKAVLWGAENNIVGGYSDKTFRPQGACTRQQAVTFLWRMAGKPEPPAGCKTFNDVKDSKAYYYNAVLWAADKGITGGYSDGTFRPGGNCSRSQMVTFLYRYNSKVLKK